MFLDVRKGYERVPHPDCPFGNYIDAHLISVVTTRTGISSSSFLLDHSIGNTPPRLSPDGERIAMVVADAPVSCGSGFYNLRFAVYSKEGKQLYREPYSPISQFDWHPDGSLVVYYSSHPDLRIIDSVDIVPVSADSSSYIVPVGMKLQPMPPAQYSETIRPVLVNRSGELNTVGFNPIYDLSWTPAID